MDAHALLTAQGWRGTGHSLHPTSDGSGLAHHILIKRNGDGRGLGSGKDAQHKAEAWWLDAFDQALKGIDTASGRTMKQTLRGGGALEAIAARKGGALARYTGSRGLYSSFVRGGVLRGTAEAGTAKWLPTPPDSGVASPAPGGGSSSSSSATMGAGGREEEGKEEEGKEEEGKGEETKEERRARREAKRLRKERRRKEKGEAERRAAKKVEKKKEKKKAEKAERKDAGETKEERRARRDARRKRKEEKRRSRASSG